MKYEIKLKLNVKKQLKKLDKQQAERILVKIYLLADNPYSNGVEKLTAKQAFRIRIGEYRVIYEIHNNQLLVLVVRVGHRREVYRA
jgi:mRNA interferase RelE/StbE